MKRKNIIKNILFCGIALLSCGILLSGAEDNLVPDNIAGFETPESLKGIQFWWSSAPDAFRRLTPAESYRGKSSLEMKLDFPSNKLGIYVPLLKNVRQGETYTASAYVKCVGKKILNIYLYTTDEKNKVVETVFKGFSVDGSWRQVKVTATLSKDAAVLGIILRTPDKDALFYVDCLGLYKAGDAPGQMPAREEKNTTEQAFVIPMTGQAPRMDGTGNDPVWKKALTIDRFHRTDGSGKPPEAPTTLKMLHDGKNLYLQFRCEEKNADSISSESLPGKPVWTDERVELHFSVTGNPDRSHQKYLTFNQAGISSFKNLDFGSGFPSGVPFRGKDFWGLEFALPASAAGKTGLTGERWLVSAGRFRNTGNRETTCLTPMKGHFGQEPEAFRPFVFSPGETLPECYCVSQGAMSVHENDQGGNRILFRLSRPAAAELEVTSLLDGKVLASQKQTADKATSDPAFYYTVAGRLGERLRITLKAGGKTLYENENLLDVIAPSFRTYVLPDPLYRELLGKEKPAMRRLGTWAHPLSEKNFTLAMKYGGDYSFRQRFDELADAGLRIEEQIIAPYLAQPNFFHGKYYVGKEKHFMPYLLEQAEKGKAPKPVVYTYYQCTGQTPDGKTRSITRDANGYFGWIADPLTQKLYLDGVAATLDKYGKSIGGMWMGDELVQLNLKYGTGMNTKFNLDNPSGFVQQADREVREKYGFGKFGIPWNNLPKDELTPYRMNAYISWTHDKVREVGRKFRETVKSRDPNMPVRAYSNSGDPLMNGLQFAGEFADVLTVQLGEGGGTISPVCQNYAYWVKLAKDISGIDTVIACPHECDSGYPTGASSEEEMLELYSQIFRGGGEGFSFWPASYGGFSPPPVFAASCSEGYPLAWQYMLAISRHVASMPRLKFPEKTDTAVLLSAESVKCDPKKNTSEGLFTMLGPYSRGWFRFLCESNLESGRARLSDYKIVYLPYAQYVKQDFPRQVEDYVKNGGTLVCGDPLVFSNSISSESLAVEREKLFGVKVMDENAKYTSVKVGKELRPIVCDSVRIQLTDKNAKVIGTFPDGSPSIIERPYGKGKVIYFAFRVFSLPHLSPSLPWLADFRTRHQELGGSVGHDIWRFRFPPMKVSLPKTPAGKCLTNNYAFWNRFRFNDGIFQNADVQASCRITRDGQGVWQPVSEAKLTDRRTCFVRTQDYSTEDYSNWVEDFSRPGNYSVTFDLKRPYPVDRMVFFWTGTLPNDLKIESAVSEGNWKPVNFRPEKRQTETLEIVRSEVSVGTSAQFLRMTFSGTDAKFILSEVELWSK